MTRFYRILIPLMVALVASAAGFQYHRYQQLSTATEQPTAPAFTLNSAQGPLSLAQLSGQGVVLYFGYTSCPDVCPVDLGVLGSALKQLSPAEQEQVQPLFITLDPERDSLQRMADYAAFFHPSLLPLHGSLEQISAVARSYGVIFEKTRYSNDPSLYWVSHSANFFLINPQGLLVKVLPRETPAGELSQQIRLLTR
ncbi:SCO family protein [Aestuariirhabdus litorea]|uniref:SCO family protein n=1 Tax=Aestuariirhabdus litorea TaxID=2528527 RepID=A0A3P3VQ15_9GAMM|nr:SCO family protein [Aestuariirhabdus litorea]RRJ83679.1 SCO family protein [Aestuariirhabdus litorea]RWW96901.1 redoxin domain-containing protein [Endozoicomonadaceae bacterium GTF-13]